MTSVRHPVIFWLNVLYLRKLYPECSTLPLEICATALKFLGHHGSDADENSYIKPSAGINLGGIGLGGKAGLGLQKFNNISAKYIPGIGAGFNERKTGEIKNVDYRLSCKIYNACF